MPNNNIAQSIASAVVGTVGASIGGISSVKVEGINAKCIDGNLLAIIDLSETQKDSKLFAFPCMCVIAGNAVFAIVLHYSFIAETNSATKTAVTGTATAEYVCGYDLTVNGHIVTKRRFGNPGVPKATAINEAKLLLNNIYVGMSAELGINSSNSSGKTVTTINTYPTSGSASISSGGLLSSFFG